MIITISIVHYTNIFTNTPEHSFIRLLYLIPIILGAYKYGFRGAIIISLVISLIYSPHILLSFDFGINTKNKLFDIVLFFVIGIVSGILVERKNLRIKMMEDDLRKYMIMEKYTNSIIESIKTGVVVVNNDMFITIINQEAKEILGVSEECIGRNFMEVFHCCDNIKDKVSSSINNNRSVENIDIIVEEYHKDIRMNLYPLTLNSSNKGIVIIIDDITELKKMQQHIQRNDKLAALGELSSGIAHEIRNPLAIIKAIEQTMKKELSDNDDAIRELEIIDEEVERANRIVKSLMTFAKPGKNTVKRDSINMLLDEVILIINKYAIQRNVKIFVSKEAVVWVNMDRELLKQAIINIVFNSVDAMPKGGKLEISARLECDKWLKIIFEDNGIGIEEQNVSNIFNPFFTTKENGTGLGLSIVHRIIEEHKGIINVYSKPGEGTRFEILLPIDKEDIRQNEENFNSR
ncbi:MAG: two-component system sensor histidine kinase NtrB [Bacillota bacterium]